MNIKKFKKILADNGFDAAGQTKIHGVLGKLFEKGDYTVHISVEKLHPWITCLDKSRKLAYRELMHLATTGDVCDVLGIYKGGDK